MNYCDWTSDAVVFSAPLSEFPVRIITRVPRFGFGRSIAGVSLEFRHRQGRRQGTGTFQRKGNQTLHLPVATLTR
jgi:hypothetical protein